MSRRNKQSRRMQRKGEYWNLSSKTDEGLPEDTFAGQRKSTRKTHIRKSRLPNGDALRKCILEDPYTPSTVIIPVVPATDNSPAVPERTTVETILNMSPENKAHYESEKEAIHLIFTGIGDEIYSTVDACKTTHEM
ncbi:hypothetical protein Tco_1492305 [Tanacetum coccineum]